MKAFITSLPPTRLFTIVPTTVPRGLKGTHFSISRPHLARRIAIASADSPSPRAPGDLPPREESTSQSSSAGSAASWQEELQMLLDPAMPTGVKQVLIQDLAKRAPEILNDFLLTNSCKGLGLRGVSDVFRQFQKDIIPDLVANGPRYVSKAAEEFPAAVSRMTRDADSIQTNMPTSIDPEELGREFRNIFNRTPEGLFTPDYRVMAKFEGYEIRQYPTLIVAETKMSPTQSAEGSVTDPTEVESASMMGQSFNNLAGFLFGKNDVKKSMKMTTPVILSKGAPEESMSFIIGEYERVEDVPKSLDDTVTLREQPGQTFAVLEFTGFVTQGEAKRQRSTLLSMLSREGIELAEGAEDSYKCMIYNGPSTLPNLRRNDLMVEVVYSKEESGNPT